MSDFRKHLEDQLQDKDFKKEYDSMRLEYDHLQAIIAAKAEQNIAQKRSSEKLQITKTERSRKCR